MSEPAPPLPPPVSAPTWRERLDVEPAQLLRWGGAAVAVLVVAVVALVGWLSSSGAPVDVDLPRAAPPVAGATSVVTETATAHAAGAVGRPGVYRLPPGARVTDLLDAAGGPSPDADLDQLNLAAPVADGERIYVPKRGEAAPPVAGAASGAPVGPVNLNTATADQLDALPGVGPATAAAILDWRKQNGRFRTVEDLLEVRGIGDARLADLRDKVKV